MLNLRPARLGWRESVSLRRFQNYNLLKMHCFRRHGVEDQPEAARDIPPGEQIRVVVMWSGRQRFEAAYGPGDVVYEQLMDDSASILLDGAGDFVAAPITSKTILES
jgi:hypothetical protein